MSEQSKPAPEAPESPALPSDATKDAPPAAAAKGDPSPSADRDASQLEAGNESRVDAGDASDEGAPEDGEPEPEPTVADLIAAHLAAETPDPAHPSVAEFAAELELHPVDGFDAHTKAIVKKPHGSIRTMLARFHAQGLREHSRVPKELLDAALDEALNGRV
jgi:hypothetical protein